MHAYPLDPRREKLLDVAWSASWTMLAGSEE